MKLQRILCDTNRAIYSAETRKEAESYQQDKLYDLYMRQQTTNDQDTIVEIIKLRQEYNFMFCNEDEGWENLKEKIDDLNKEMKTCQDIYEQVAIQQAILQVLNDQITMAQHLEDEERLIDIQNKFNASELSTLCELLLLYYNKTLRETLAESNNPQPWELHIAGDNHHNNCNNINDHNDKNREFNNDFEEEEDIRRK